jgi:hypothetical protein
MSVRIRKMNPDVAVAEILMQQRLGESRLFRVRQLIKTLCQQRSLHLAMDVRQSVLAALVAVG